MIIKILHNATSSLSKFDVFPQVLLLKRPQIGYYAQINTPFFPNQVLCRPIKKLFDGINTFHVGGMVHLYKKSWVWDQLNSLKIFFNVLPFLAIPRLKLLKYWKKSSPPAINSCQCEAINSLTAISTFIVTVAMIITVVTESHHHHHCCCHHRHQHHQHHQYYYAELSFTLDFR